MGLEIVIGLSEHHRQWINPIAVLLEETHMGTHQLSVNPAQRTYAMVAVAYTAAGKACIRLSQVLLNTTQTAPGPTSLGDHIGTESAQPTPLSVVLDFMT